MDEGRRPRALLVVVSLTLTALALGVAAPAVAAGDGTETTTVVTHDEGETVTDHTGTPVTRSPTVTAATTQDNETDDAVEEILDAIPDTVLDELPEGFVENLLGNFEGGLAGDIVDQLDTLEDIPDTVLEPVLLDIVDNVPDEVLNNSQQLVEDPPDEIPAILCRADDMAEKADPGGREEWGPTDVNAQLGNQNLTVGTNELGTVTVFKYPNPSYGSQVKHHAMDRREPYYGADPNSGTFLGLTYTADGEQQFDWLRDWGPVSTSNPDHAEHVDQYWQSDTSDTLVTEYRNESLGLTVTVVDAIPKDEDVHVRDISVEASNDSAVTDVEVVSYANFNLVDNKDALIPTQDWCEESENDADVSYDADSDAIVYETDEYEPGLPAEMIERAGPQFSVATAMSFDGESSQHQVAGDDFVGDSPADPYRLLGNGSHSLPGNNSHTGQVSTALTRDIDFENGSGEATVYFGAASDEEPGRDLGEEAVAAIDAVQNRSLDSITEEKAEWFEQYVGDAPLPADAPENVTQLAKRALVSLVQVWDPYTENEQGYSGNIVAGAPTQAPYGADWIRDGAYFNYALDRFFGQNAGGLHSWVNQHNRWYMSLQQNRDGDCPEHCYDNMAYYDLGLGVLPNNTLLRDALFDQVPFVSTTHEGGWAMNYYADGVPAGPLGSEIDEDAYGPWTFWDHYAMTGNESYLERIYPAISLAADRLTDDCVDEETGLQCPRPEDDNIEYTQSATGGASVYTGLDAATKAAAEMYQITGDEAYAEDAMDYAQRRDELRVAMDEFYWQADEGTYGSGRVAMPAFVRPLDDPRMQRQLQNMWENVNRTFSGELDAGQYEAKNLIGLGVAARVTESPPVSRDQLQRGVEWLASEAARAESTHIMGEAWIRETYADGGVDAAVSQPHIWQQILTYKAALLAYGNESIDDEERIGYEAYTEWRRHDASLGEMETAAVTTGETAEMTVTVENEAPVEQAYHLTYELEGPDGDRYNVTATDVGPVAAGGSETVTLSWDAVDVPTGEYDATVSAWKAAATDAAGNPDPLAIAEEPTALSDPQYRQVELDSAATTLTVTEDGTDDDGTDDGTGDDGTDDGTDDDGTDDGTGDDGTDDGTDDDGTDDGSGDDGTDDGAGDDGADDGSGDGSSADGGGPGFGVVVVALGLLGAALLAGHRQRRRG